MWEDDDIENALWSGLGILEPSLSVPQGQPLSNIDVGEKVVTVVFDLPGVKRDEVSVICTDDSVSVSAEVTREVKGIGFMGTSRASYSKEVVLPVRVDSGKATAKFRNGMIIVKLPRRNESGLKESGRRLRLTA